MVRQTGGKTALVKVTYLLGSRNIWRYVAVLEAEWKVSSHLSIWPHGKHEMIKSNTPQSVLILLQKKAEAETKV